MHIEHVRHPETLETTWWLADDDGQVVVDSRGEPQLWTYGPPHHIDGTPTKKQMAQHDAECELHIRELYGLIA